MDNLAEKAERLKLLEEEDDEVVAAAEREPQITSLNPEERIAARRLRIEKRLKARESKLYVRVNCEKYKYNVYDRSDFSGVDRTMCR